MPSAWLQTSSEQDCKKYLAGLDTSRQLDDSRARLDYYGVEPPRFEGHHVENERDGRQENPCRRDSVGPCDARVEDCLREAGALPHLPVAQRRRGGAPARRNAGEH